MAEIKTIQSIQFKRGTKAKLELLLKGENKPLRGEPIWEIPDEGATAGLGGKLKIGDGVKDYADLEYISGASVDIKFIITEPQNNQVLFYDSTLGGWVNKKLTDDQTINLLSSGLALVGYDSATTGQMPTKGDSGLVWKTPVSDAQIQAAVAEARGHAETATQAAGQAAAKATAAANSASAAASSQSEAGNYASLAAASVIQIQEWVDKKFWWGSLAEYNAEIAAHGVNPGTFYFVRAEN